MMTGVTIEQPRAAKKQAYTAVASLAPVVGVGVTRVGDGYGVKVNLESAPAGVTSPSSINGVPLRVEVTGQVQKQGTDSR